MPNLRFQGFEGEWNESKLGEISLLRKGNGISKDKLSSNGQQCILYGEIYTKYKSEIITKVLSKTNIDSTNLVRSKTNDVIIPSSGETAIDISTARCVLFDNILLGGDLNIIRLQNGNDGRFLSYQLNGKRKYDIAKIAQGVSVVHLYGERLKKLRIKYPSSREQNKISEFLTLIDQRIDTQSQIIKNLQSLMKGVIQRLYSSQIRLKKDDGTMFSEWQMKYGNELFENVSDKNHNSDLPILAITQEHGAIPRDLIDYNVLVNEKSIENYKKVNIGDFIISLRSFQGGIEYSKYSGICSPAYIILRATTDICEAFYKYYFKTQKYITELNRKLEGIRDGKMISYKYFSEIPLPYPCLEEQQKIAKTVSSIDKKIEIETKLLEQLTNQKQYLLQNLFI